MRPTPAHAATGSAGWPRVGRDRTRLARFRSLARGRRPGLLNIAAAILIAALALGAYYGPEASVQPPATAAASTAFLGTSTCADWQSAGAASRMTIVRLLGVAATQPDPENPGATLGQGAAYSLFQRVCSTRASRSTLLYEAYNRAASFQRVGAGTAPISGSYRHP